VRVNLSFLLYVFNLYAKIGVRRLSAWFRSDKFLLCHSCVMSVYVCTTVHNAIMHYSIVLILEAFVKCCWISIYYCLYYYYINGQDTFATDSVCLFKFAFFCSFAMYSFFVQCLCSQSTSLIIINKHDSESHTHVWRLSTKSVRASVEVC